MKVFPVKSPQLILRISRYLQENYSFKTLAVWIFGLNTGLRVSDILKLEWKDLMNEDGRIVMRLFQKAKKTGKTHYVYLCPKLQIVMKTLRQMCPNDVYVFQSEAVCFRRTIKGERISTERGKRQKDVVKPYSSTYIGNAIKDAVKALGLDLTVNTHTMRKSFAWANYQKGYDLTLIGDILQHADLRETKLYICLDEDERRELYMQSDLGFPPEIEDGCSMDVSRMHMKDVSPMIHKISVLPKNIQTECIEYLAKIYDYLMHDPKKRNNYVRRIIKAALYLDRRNLN